ncbi:MAG: FIST C-terminal domain-containing protein [Phycisphaerales bacterium]|nr:FIST C-terminal domain-containing protein [Phycisphaerales bacterium]
MKFLSRLSLRRETEEAVHDLCVDLKAFEPDLAVVFASHHYGPEFDELVRGIYTGINCRNLIGCTGESIVGPTAEIEHQPAVVLWVAKLPGVRVLPFVIDQEDVAGLGDNREAWRERLGAVADDVPSIIMLPDPFSVDVQTSIDALDASFPGSTIVGGMASGASGPGQNRLFLNDQTLRRGMVGVTLTGNVRVSSVVSQGCRPVGEPFVITKAEDNFIQELGGRPAYAVLQDVYKQADESEQNLMRKGLQVGRLIDEQRRDLGVGGFLVRNMMGVREDQALAVGDFLRPGQTVQFHVRDSRTADEEMERMLVEESQRNGPTAGGALLFTCNGRGRNFFEQSNHDIGLVNRVAENCHTAGFFAQGEIGPVGGKTFIHGFTSSIILFREP